MPRDRPYTLRKLGDMYNQIVSMTGPRGVDSRGRRVTILEDALKVAAAIESKALTDLPSDQREKGLEYAYRSMNVIVRFVEDADPEVLYGDAYDSKIPSSVLRNVKAWRDRVRRILREG